MTTLAKFPIIDLTGGDSYDRAQDVRDAVDYVLTEVTLRRRPLDGSGDEEMQRCVDVLGESLFTKLWGYASAVSGRGEAQRREHSEKTIAAAQKAQDALDEKMGRSRAPRD